MTSQVTVLVRDPQSEKMRSELLRDLISQHAQLSPIITLRYDDGGEDGYDLTGETPAPELHGLEITMMIPEAPEWAIAFLLGALRTAYMRAGRTLPEDGLRIDIHTP